MTTDAAVLPREHKGIAHRLPKGAYDFGMTQETAALRDFLQAGDK